MKKFLLPLLATTLLLTGCSGNGNTDLPSGGKELAVTEIEEIARRCGETTRATLDAMSSGVALDFNLNGSFNYTFGVNGKYHVKVEDFNADVGIVTSRFFGMNLLDVEAAVTIKNLKAKIDISVESGKEGQLIAFTHEFGPVAASAYLKDGYVYLDLSNDALKAATPGMLKKAVPEYKDYTDEQINAAMNVLFGTNRKAKINLAKRLDIDVPDIPVLPGARRAAVVEAVKAFIKARVEEKYDLSKFVTIKTYEGNKWGIKAVSNKENVKSVLSHFFKETEVAKYMEGITKADGSCVILTDVDSRLASIGLGTDLQISCPVVNGEVQSVTGMISTFFAFEYGKIVSFPTDLTSYTDSPIVPK